MPFEFFEENGLRQQSGPYIMKNVPRLWIGTMEDRSKFAEGRLLACLIDAYRDVFGHGAPVDEKSWGEYAKCKNIGCSGKLSFEAAHNLSSYIYIPDLESNLPVLDLPPCPFCHSSMTLFYSPHELRTEMQGEFLQHESYGAFLAGEDGRVYGFSYGWVDDLQGIWEDKFQEFYRSSNVTFQTCLDQCQRHFNCERELFYWAEGGHLLHARSRDIFFAMTQSLFSDFLTVHSGIQLIFSTTPSSNAHAIMIGAGAKVVCSLDDHPLQILSAKASDLWEELRKSPSRFFRDNRVRIQHALKARRGSSGTISYT